MNPVEIRKKGLEALNNALGLVGIVRFLWQFESGREVYNKDRNHWLKFFTIDSVVEEIKQNKKE
jgi:hypothetical protein